MSMWTPQTMFSSMKARYFRRREEAREAARRKQFMNNAVDDFAAMVYSTPCPRWVSGATSDWERSQFQNSQDIVISTLHGWVEDEALTNTQQWDDSVRFINALNIFASNGDIDCIDDEEMNMMRFLFYTRLYRYPQAIAHFVDNHELMELIMVLGKEEKRTQESIPFDFLPEEVGRIREEEIRMTHERLLRLYDYDMKLDQEQLSLPLEMRLHLSGFYEDEEGLATQEGVVSG